MGVSYLSNIIHNDLEMSVKVVSRLPKVDQGPDERLSVYPDEDAGPILGIVHTGVTEGKFARALP